jgi:transcriptional regulator with XRE-family HTH domain
MDSMAGNNGNGAVTHFGRQMKKERLSRGWTLREMEKRTGVDYATLSKVETGKRPPTERLAKACDSVFPERRGWFQEFYAESRDWMPPAFRSWGEYEDKAHELLVWSPGIVDGLAQTADYARVLLRTYPGATDEVVGVRLANRMERQRRLLRDDGPTIILLVELSALYRGAGSAAIMADQCARLAELAQRESMTLQLVPPVTIPVATASIMLADDAAYTENALSGAVYTNEESVTRLRRLLGTVRAEARPASESLAMIRRVEKQWRATRSAPRRTARQTADSASRSARTT